MKYYYLVAGLPTLELGEPPPRAAADFLSACSHLVGPAELEELRRAVEGRTHEGVTDFLKQWTRTDTQLRNAAARVRAGKLSVEAGAHVKDHAGWDTYVEKAVADAYAKPNPLERELALDHFRWKALDEMTLMEPFGLGALLAYAIRLRMATRWAAMEEKSGRETMEKTLEEMTKV